MKSIIISTPLIPATLDGRKTMTRRVIKPQPRCEEKPTLCVDGFWRGRYRTISGIDNVSVEMDEIKPCKYGQPGDRLFVKEVFCKFKDGDIIYKADDPQKTIHLGTGKKIKWTSPHFMRREFSRITLEILNVRVERIQDISEADVVAEGFGEQIKLHDKILVSREMALDAGDKQLEGTVYQDEEFDIVGDRDRFIECWDSLNASRGFGWESNCFVWAIEFKQIK